MKKHLNEEECLALLSEYGTPIHVIEHCKAVSDVATKIGEKLNAKGADLDINLIKSASLLHDIARVEQHHDQVGAKYMREKKYFDEADIIEKHMTYSNFNPIGKSTETDLVCLGDRVCKEDKYVGLDERMDYILNKARKDPKAKEIILKKKGELADYIKDLEMVIGEKLDDIMKG